MRYAAEMRYVPSFIKIGSGIQKLNGGGGYTEQDDLTSLLLLLLNKESRLKIYST
jgi:hypothetical protein